MEEIQSYEGGCLCGAVRYQMCVSPMWQGHCHCTDCRKYVGARSSLLAVLREKVELTGELKFHEVRADSGSTVRHGFCPECGSPVLNENSCKPEMYIFHAGSLDEPERFKPTMSIYAARAPSWDPANSSLPTFDEMPEAPSAK